MAKQVHTVDADSLHTMAQPDQQYVQPAFVTPGIPGSPLANRTGMPDGKQSNGTAMLTSFLKEQPNLNNPKG